MLIGEPLLRPTFEAAQRMSMVELASFLVQKLKRPAWLFWRLDGWHELKTCVNAMHRYVTSKESSTGAQVASSYLRGLTGDGPRIDLATEIKNG